MIRTLLHISVPPERGGEVVSRYAELEVLEASIRESGALSCELAQSTADRGSLIVLALWRDAESYAHWLSHPVRERIAESMSDLAIVPQGSAYEVRSSVVAAD